MTLSPRLQMTTQPRSDDDPYRLLVLSIIRRAIDDAQDDCFVPGDQSPEAIQAEAVAWVLDGRALTELLELANLDSDTVVAQIRQRVPQRPVRQQLTLF